MLCCLSAIRTSNAAMAVESCIVVMQPPPTRRRQRTKESKLPISGLKLTSIRHPLWGAIAGDLPGRFCWLIAHFDGYIKGYPLTKNGWNHTEKISNLPGKSENTQIDQLWRHNWIDESDVGWFLEDLSCRHVLALQYDVTSEWIRCGINRHEFF